MHPSQSKALFLGCALFGCWVSLGVLVTNSLIECYFIMIIATIIGIFVAILFYLNYTFGLSLTSGSATTHFPGWMFLLLDIFFEYWIEHVKIGFLYVMFEFFTMIFYRGVACFPTNCPCCVCCCKLTTCFLHIGPFFGNRVWNDSRFVRHNGGQPFHCFLNMLYIYPNRIP